MDLILIEPISVEEYSKWLAKQESTIQSWLERTRFRGERGEVALIPNGEGGLKKVIVGIESAGDYWSFGGLPRKLPAGEYRLGGDYSLEQLEQIALAWQLGCYQFKVYKKPQPIEAKLVFPESIQRVVRPLTETIYLVRDLINTPTEDLGPAEFAEAVQQVAQEFQAKLQQVVGDDLLKENYPLIHAVGRAAENPPRLIDLTWGKTEHPKLTLIGKGITYDTGGLSIKPTSNMLLMKKDMGGAALALGLARMIMLQQWPVRLRLLIGAADNAISGNSYRPGDVYFARNGKSVEVTDTDAEGRLVLADLLCEAAAEKPQWLFDFATLTGAQRVALGTDIPSFFTDHENIEHALKKASKDKQELLWQLPLYKDYKFALHSDIADCANTSTSPYGGAINAALFLQQFVSADIPWCHFDLNAWNLRDLPGRPKGGEAQGFQAILAAMQALIASRV